MALGMGDRKRPRVGIICDKASGTRDSLAAKIMSLEEARLMEEVWSQISLVWGGKTKIIKQEYDPSQDADLWTVRFPNGETKIYTVRWGNEEDRVEKEDVW